MAYVKGDRVRCIAKDFDDEVEIGEEGVVTNIWECPDGQLLVIQFPGHPTRWPLTDDEVELVE